MPAHRQLCSHIGWVVLLPALLSHSACVSPHRSYRAYRHRRRYAYPDDRYGDHRGAWESGGGFHHRDCP